MPDDTAGVVSRDEINRLVALFRQFEGGRSSQETQRSKCLNSGKSITMQTSVEFTSDGFPPYPDEEERINPGIWGKRLAEFIVSKLPDYGVRTLDLYSEDWGWAIRVKNEAFPMYIGCGNQTGFCGNRFLCFIDPSKPEVRKGLFKKVSTLNDIERVAKALDKALKSHPAIRDLQWRDENDHLIL